MLIKEVKKEGWSDVDEGQTQPLASVERASGIKCDAQWEIGGVTGNKFCKLANVDVSQMQFQ